MTPRQKDTLDFIEARLKETGISPPYKISKAREGNPPTTGDKAS